MKTMQPAVSITIQIFNILLSLADLRIISPHCLIYFKPKRFLCQTLVVNSLFLRYNEVLTGLLLFIFMFVKDLLEKV